MLKANSCDKSRRIRLIVNLANLHFDFIRGLSHPLHRNLVRILYRLFFNTASNCSLCFDPEFLDILDTKILTSSSLMK